MTKEISDAFWKIETLTTGKEAKQRILELNRELLSEVSEPARAILREKKTVTKGTIDVGLTNMSKQDKGNKPLTKDRLVGMHVVDSEGNEAGTIQDIASTVGKVGMSMIIEIKSGGTREIPFTSIQAAGDYVILKPQTKAAQTQTTVSQTTAQPQQAQSQICPTCGGPLTYIARAPWKRAHRQGNCPHAACSRTKKGGARARYPAKLSVVPLIQ